MRIAYFLSVVLSATTVSAHGSHGGLRCSGIAWYTLRDGAQFCPRRHSLLADVSLIDLSWSAWGISGAKGHGFEAHEIMPGESTLLPVGIHLSGSKTCPKGLRIYSQATITVYASHDRRVLSHETSAIPCNGETGGGNG
jgi:hypothetical protein